VKYTVLTLFPEQVRNFLETSIMGRALKNGAFSLETVQIRDFCGNAYGKVDATMFGGGTGMLMQCEPVYAAWQSVIDASMDLDQRPHTIFLSPKGAVFNQQKAMELSKYPHLIFLCGHYEGVDQRVLDTIVDEEISIGDYVLTGGEIAACVVIDSVSRMLPGVLPDASAYENESHMGGILEAPQYTRPEIWREKAVPPVLLSGHHAKIIEWRRLASLYETWQKRPDLFDRQIISTEDWEILLQWKEESQAGQ
jgi:tRNA (guanine37-N1)-methyltransferase